MLLQFSRNFIGFSNNLRNNSTNFFGLCYLKISAPKKQMPMNGIFFFQKRNFYNLWRKSSIEELKIKDNIPISYKLIYKNRLDTYLLFTQIITTSTATLMALFFMFSDDGVTLKRSGEKLNRRHFENDDLVFITIFFLLVVLLQSILIKMPVRIYNHPQKKHYTLVFYGNIPFTQRSCTCKAGELFEYYTDRGHVLPWNDSTYVLKTQTDQKKLYLIERYFQRPADLYIMMGVQSDPDVDEVSDEINK